MARRNKFINNSVTGQSIRFLQTRSDTDGRLLEIESSFAAHSSEPVAHYHPVQEELLTVLEGVLSVRINGVMHRFAVGEQFRIAPGMVHSMWNDRSVPARVNWKVTPALSTEYLLETAMGMAAAGKVNKKGMPPLLQTALLMRKYEREFRIARPPYAVQRILFAVLVPFAFLAGYRAVYGEFFG